MLNSRDSLRSDPLLPAIGGFASTLADADAQEVKKPLEGDAGPGRPAWWT